MIKEIRCQFEDVKEFQQFILEGKTYTTYTKVPAPRSPYQVETLVCKPEHDGRTRGNQKYITMDYKEFSPNAYNHTLKRYEQISSEADCIIYPKADKE